MPERFELIPVEPRSAVLVLGGSSGRIEESRVRLLAEHGFAASSVRWFGGPGQAETIREVPLETFDDELDRLAQLGVPLSVLATSKGAEAALLVAVDRADLRTVIAIAPTDVVWQGFADELDLPPTSSWTRRGRTIPFVPYDDGWVAATDPPEFVTMYGASRSRFPSAEAAAAIPVERIEADLLLIAGDDDRVWDSAGSARRIEKRRARAGRRTEVVVGAGAGHRLLLPGERAVAGGIAMGRGGTGDTDSTFGLRVWPQLLAALQG